MAERLYAELLFRSNARQDAINEKRDFGDAVQAHCQTCKGQAAANIRPVGTQRQMPDPYLISLDEAFAPKPVLTPDSMTNKRIMTVLGNWGFKAYQP